jgi:hypothetical protein
MAHAHTPGAHPVPGKFTASKGMKTVYSVAIFLGLLLLAVGLYKDQVRTWHSFLTSFFYFTSLALGALFFVAIQHVVKAGWSVNIRRIAEAMTAPLPIAAAAAVVLLLGAKSLYIWLDPATVAHDELLAGKAAYLNWGFFIVRLVVFFGLWLIFRKVIVGRSIEQDKTGDENLTIKNVGASVGFVLVFALSYSLFSVDTLMSLQPHWYSTIWGVYCFAGLFQSTLAVLVILTVMLMQKGLVKGLISEDHLHDLGKFLKAFTVFYAYIGFSQFLLIWYANLPEETIFYLSRSTGGWEAATLSLLVFKFIVPFLLLLPKAAKRTPAHLILVSTIILIMQYVDVHWMVYPNYDSNQWLFSWQELGPIALFFGLFVYSVSSFLSKHNLVPIKDPRIEESIHHHVTY